MRRGFGAFISAAVVFSVESARISTEVLETLDQPQWNFNGLTLGSMTGGALIPELVPPPNTTFEVVNREMELGVGSVSNDYQWAFLTINQGGNAIPVNQWFAQISGQGFFGVVSGTRRTVVRDNNGRELFIIEASRLGTSTSWRIRHPLTNQIMFTINKDFFGTGFLGIRDEWRIYRGRERDATQIYYIVADYSAHSHRFYHNEDEYQNSVTPCAQSRFYTRGGTYTQGFVSDSIGVSVGPGEDTALVLSTTIVIDMLNEERAERARAREERRAAERAREQREAELDFHSDVGVGNQRRRHVTVTVGNQRRRVGNQRRRVGNQRRRASNQRRRVSNQDGNQRRRDGLVTVSNQRRRDGLITVSNQRRRATNLRRRASNQRRRDSYSGDSLHYSGGER
jgi:hypothetical protein